MKKMMGWAASVLSAAVLLLAIAGVCLALLSVAARGRNATLLGYKPYIVSSDSMEGVFSAGDVIVSRRTDPAALEVGDIVTFLSMDPDLWGQVVTHRIVSRTEYAGEPALVTRGEANDLNDPYPVLYGNVLGRYCFSIPGLGHLLAFVRTPAGYVVVIMLPFLLLIALQVAGIVDILRQMRRSRRQEAAQEAAEEPLAVCAGQKDGAGGGEA